MVKRQRGGGMRMSVTVERYEVEQHEKPMNCLRNIRELIQQSMKEQGITPEQARKSLGIKRYEK